ncbi:DUF1992 domain-containing protein [Spongisporangium articulatum]|uniref:DUF1992 domain-containing protein n=1 Tax=Spongisporangium articulatum TaxID=3362603 RepID=A0ABW8AL38_9ACTN
MSAARRRPESPVERQIREAHERGDFDDLPGAGRPIEGLDQPFSAEKWAVDRIRAEGGDVGALLSPMLALRRERARFLATIDDVRSEAAVRELVREFNSRLLAELRRPMDGPLIPVGLLDEEEAAAAWRATRPSPEPVAAVEVAAPRRFRWSRGWLTRRVR